MRCHQCNTETAGTETSPGTVSSICPECNVKLTGVGHHEGAYDVDARGVKIAAPPGEKPTAVKHRVARKRKTV